MIFDISAMEINCHAMIVNEYARTYHWALSHQCSNLSHYWYFSEAREQILYKL